MPYRGFADPKRRLASHLSLDERRGLSQAMLKDVMLAMNGVRRLSRKLLVSQDVDALRFAVCHGLEPLVEQEPLSYRSAAEQAAAAAHAASAKGVLVLPADLPLLTAADVEALLEKSEAAPVTLAPAYRGGGTNALLCVPPGAIPYLYGPGSSRAHLAAASQRGLASVVVELPGFGRDVDLPEDMQWLLATGISGRSTATVRYIEEIGLRQRLSAEPESSTKV